VNQAGAPKGSNIREWFADAWMLKNFKTDLPVIDTGGISLQGPINGDLLWSPFFYKFLAVFNLCYI